MSLTSVASVTSVNYVTSVARVCNVFLCYPVLWLFIDRMPCTLGGARGEAADRPRRSIGVPIHPTHHDPSIPYSAPCGGPSSAAHWKNYSGSGWPGAYVLQINVTLLIYNNQVWFLHDTECGTIAGRGSRAPRARTRSRRGQARRVPARAQSRCAHACLHVVPSSACSDAAAAVARRWLSALMFF